jgi:hypothetical protein
MGRLTTLTGTDITFLSMAARRNARGHGAAGASLHPLGRIRTPPHNRRIERELVERPKGEPFALLGVDCERDKELARRVMARERMTWPNWFDGDVGTGPIAKRYHIRFYPSVFILDAKGVIPGRGAGLDAAIDKLLAAMKQPTPGRATSLRGPRKRRNASTVPGALGVFA